MRALLLISLLLIGCSKAESPVFDGQRAFQEVQALLARGPRIAGTPGALRAAEHLRNRLETHGVSAELDSFTEQTPLGNLTFHNVLGRLPGKTKRLIVLCSHFDTKSGISGDFQGANDSGSSSGVLLELVRVLSERAPLETEFLIAFFDGEECCVKYGPRDGLHGSRRLAEQIAAAGGVRAVEAVILLDMVGDRDLNITVPRNSSRVLVKELFSAARELGVRPQLGLYGSELLDDHVPFLMLGMPAIDVIDFEYGSATGLNDYWHTTNDTLDKLSAESMQTVGDVVLQMIENLQ